MYICANIKGKYNYNRVLTISIDSVKGSYMFFSSITADYTKMGYPKAIVRALDFLKNTDLKALPGGRHAIEGDMMYANVDDVETK